MPERDRIEGLIEGERTPGEELAPEVDIPEPPKDVEEIDPAVRTLFWQLVAVFNVALIGVSVGPMILYFEDKLIIGGGLLAIGILTGGYGIWRYRRFTRRNGPDRQE